MLLQALGEIGTVVSEDGDSDVRVDIAGHVWTFNPSCCTRLPPPLPNTTDKKQSSDDSGDDSSDDDGDQEIIGLYVLYFCWHVDFWNTVCTCWETTYVLNALKLLVGHQETLLRVVVVTVKTVFQLSVTATMMCQCVEKCKYLWLCLWHVTVGNPGLEQMIRSLVMRHHPDRHLMDAVAAGDIDTVRTVIAHLPTQPNVCHVHVCSLFDLHNSIVILCHLYTDRQMLQWTITTNNKLSHRTIHTTFITVIRLLQ